MRISLSAIALLVLSIGLISCSGTATYNPTAYPYTYNQSIVDQQPIKKVILAPVRLGTPLVSYLRKREGVVRAKVKDYLKSNGYEILPNYQFENGWQQAIRSYGNVYDPTTGKINMNAWQAAMVTVTEKLRKEPMRMPSFSPT